MEWQMKLQQPKTGQRQTALCKRLDPSFQQALLALDREVYESMEQKENYVPAAAMELDYFFRIDARIYGVFCQDKLAAYYVLWHHDGDVEIPTDMQRQITEWGMYNLAMDLPFIPKQEWNKALEIHRALVHPAYHNLGLNQYFLPKIFQHVGQLGYHHLTATISPFNCPSFISAMKSGLTVGGLKQKYESVIRYIMYLDLTGNTAYAGQEVLCSHKNIQEQLLLLAAGYRGKGIHRDSQTIDPETGRAAVSIVYDMPCRAAVTVKSAAGPNCR